MLGKPWFLLLVALISLAACAVCYKSVTAATDQIVLETATIASLALATALISLVLLFAGCAIRSITRPWQAKTISAR